MIKKLHFIFLSLLFIATSFSQTTVYVSPTGTSSGTGTMSSPKTIGDALGAANLGAGFTIILMDGTYYLENVQYLWQKQGTAASPIIIKAQNKHQAILKGNPAKLADYWAVFYLSGCKYVTVDGLVTMHESGSQDLSPGIRVSDASEFITIKNCLSYGNGGSGITSEGCDHIIIEDNICHSNSTRNEINTSGISMFQQKPLTSNSDYYGCIIRRNICYNNTCDIPFKYLNESSPNPTDGNGIIIDSFDTSSTPYGKNVLVENNVCYNNGGSGIKAYRSSLVRIINNTVYHNNTILSKYNPYFAEIYVFESQGIGNPKVYNNGIYNNVVVSRQNTTYEDKAMVVDNDLGKVYNNYIVGVGAKFNNYSYEVANFPSANTVRALTDQDYPRFTNAASNDFTLKSDSPLIGADTQTYGATVDIKLIARPQGTYSDVGAYEYVYPPSSPAPVVNNNCGLIANSSFENDFSSWSNANSAASIGTAAQSRSGNKCAVLNASTGLSTSGFTNVNASKKLNFEVYARIEGSPTNAQIGIDYRNAAGTKTGTSNVFAINTTSYKLYSVLKTLPAGTTKVNIWTYKNGTTGKIYIDDFCMTNTVAAKESGEEEEYTEEDVMSNFKIYPNPATTSLAISTLDTNENSMTIQIMDLMGKQILNRTIDLNLGQEFVELNIENFAPGNYFVKVIQGDREKTSKLIKE